MARKRKDSVIFDIREVNEALESPSLPRVDEHTSFYSSQAGHDQIVETYPKYVFQKLDQGADYIRLFKLQHGEFHDYIVGTLETFHIRDAPAYRAMSYEWMKDIASHNVYMDEDVVTTVTIGENLFIFLRNYRTNMILDDPVEYLWIDHVCINQDDKFEKSHQVRRMRMIFEKAYEVVAWLGPDYDCTKSHRRTSFDSNNKCKCVTTFGQQSFRSSFWTRLWIQQEMVLAKRVIFMIGQRAVPASELQEDLEWDQDLIDDEPALRAALYSNEKKAFTLLKAIKLFSHKICHEPKDRVFGLLGMVYKHHRISVDYNLDTYQVFWETVDKVFTLEHFGEKDFRENFVTDTLVKLGVHMGFYSNDAFKVCQAM